MIRDLVALAIGLVIFSVAHSLLAATRVQRAIERRGVSPRAYRLAYSVTTVALLLAFAPLFRHDFPAVWQARGPWRVLLVALQAGALAGLAWSARGFDVPEFLGLRAPRARDGARPVAAPGARTHLSGDLQTSGAYALCRHPIYFFTALFFSAWPSMDEGKLVFAAWIWAYSWVGSIFEERRLVDELGEPYRAYRAARWRLLPLGGWLRSPDRPAAPPTD